jgi:hypothetical protein
MVEPVTTRTVHGGTMRARIAVAALAAMSLVSIPTAHGAPAPRAQASGGVVYLDAAGEEIHVEFNGSGTPSDARGVIHFYNPVTKVSYIADVTCYAQFGNIAQLAGEVRHGDIGPAAIRLVVQDNGEPGTADMLRITRRPSGTDFHCERLNSADRPVVSGNVQVHGRDTQPSALTAGAPDERPGDEDL